MLHTPMCRLAIVMWFGCANVAEATSYSTSGRITANGGLLSMEVTFGWPTEDTPDIALPCVRESCWLGPSVTILTPFDNWQRAYNPHVSQLTIRYAKGELLSTVRARWVSQYGVTGTLNEPAWATSAGLPYVTSALACFQYWPNQTGSEPTVGINLPGTVCSTPAPPNVNCDSIPSMIYDFGTVAAGRTDNLRISQRHFLSCTNATNVTLKLQSALVLTRSLTANLSVNGRTIGPQGVTLDARGDSVPLDFVVTTVGTENTGGVYNASSVLIMEYN